MRRAFEEDLPVLIPEDFTPADEAAPVNHVEPADIAPSRPPWSRIAAFSLAVVGVSALITIGWQEREQTRIARHEACLNDAQAAASVSQTQATMTTAITRCFRNPKALLGGTEVVIPGVVSVHLGEATSDLAQVGLKGRVVHGPSAANAYIIDQAPRAGVSVPAGTVVDITTRP
jgi:hypothetical protein